MRAGERNMSSWRVPWRRDLRLRGEWALLFLAAPLLLALALPPAALFPGLFLVTLIGLGLLHRTPGFVWRELFLGIGTISWWRVLVVCLCTAAVSAGLILLTHPAAFLAFPRQEPVLWLGVMLLYPLLSALPQEIVFRPLFFRRYGGLFRHDRAAILANATVFGLAHLMFWNVPAVVMTFAGGLVFAWVYRVRANFPEAVVMHALAGNIMFTLGLGVFFYSGAVQAPF